jgi:hypothetical protein
MPGPHRSQYYILPKDDPLRAVNILRTAAGQDPLSDHIGTAREADCTSSNGEANEGGRSQDKRHP